MTFIVKIIQIISVSSNFSICKTSSIFTMEKSNQFFGPMSDLKLTLHMQPPPFMNNSIKDTHTQTHTHTQSTQEEFRNQTQNENESAKQMPYRTDEFFDELSNVC